MIKKIFFLLFTLVVGVMGKDALLLPTSFEANFKQTITSDKGKKIHYSGSLLFSSPNHFKWSYNAPTKKEVCTNSSELLVVDHDLEQISTYLLESKFNLIKILSKAKLYKELIYVAKHNDKNYTIGLNSKKQLQSVVYKDDLDNTVVIVFSKVTYKNSKIKASKLKCNYPAHYDEIRG